MHERIHIFVRVLMGEGHGTTCVLRVFQRAGENPNAHKTAPRPHASLDDGWLVSQLGPKGSPARLMGSMIHIRIHNEKHTGSALEV